MTAEGGTAWGTVDIDGFIARHRERFVRYLVEERSQPRDFAERLVHQVLLRAQVRWAWFASEEQAFAWCQLRAGRFLEVGLTTEDHLWASVTPLYRSALYARAEGLDDAQLGARVGVPAAAVPDLMRRARDAAAWLRD
jgi:hypothetical protein